MGIYALHQTLMRLAGWAPDEMVFSARELLAAGRSAEVEQAVAFVAPAHDQATLTPCFFFSTGTEQGLPHSIDLTDDTSKLDAVDLAAIAAVSGTSDGAATVAGLWRAWRMPALATPWPPPRRVYLALARSPDPDGLPAITARVQRALTRAGEISPQVESFLDPAELPLYQRMALASSALLWTDRPTPKVGVADLFDPLDEAGGPGFAGSRPVLTDAERAKLLSYLDSGHALLTTTALMDDVLDQSRHAVVPMSFRTDGTWVWTDAAAYYLRTYAITPDSRLLEHARAVRYEIDEVDAIASHRALAALQAAASEQ